MEEEKILETELRKKKEEYEAQVYKAEQALRKLKDRRISERKQFIRDNFILKEEHKKLLKEMEFLGMWLGDTVSIGADGKRPFGNSFMYEDIVRILGWEKPNDDLSNEQMEEARKLLEELPLALNEIIKKS